MARSPASERYLDFDYGPRDYFRGALLHAADDPVHVSAAYQSRIDGYLKFALSAAVRDRDGRLLAVLVVSSTTDATLGVSDLQADVRKVVVLGPLDPNHARSFPPGTHHVVVVHPAYRHGQAATAWHDARLDARAPPHGGHDLRPRGEAWPFAGVYFDPVGRHDGRYSGPWVAGLRPARPAPTPAPSRGSAPARRSRCGRRAPAPPPTAPSSGHRAGRRGRSRCRRTARPRRAA